MRIDSGLVTLISEQLDDHKDDLDTFWDTLDGETDILDFVGIILERLMETESQIEAIDILINKYLARKSGLAKRKDDLKNSLYKTTKWTGQKKIPHAIATVSLRKGVNIVNIINQEVIPSQLCKVTVTPDKTEIKKQLQAGVKIDGAELVQTSETISIRMK
jgi:hypothetical protein